MAYPDLTNARNAFLAKAQSVIIASDFSTATNTDLILGAATFKAFDTVNNFDPFTVNAVSFITSVGNLETYLQDPSNRQAFNDICNSVSAMTAVIASTTAMTAVAASTTAMTAVAASTTAMTEVIASTTAMTAVAASTAAITAVAASSTAMTALNASTAAMNTLYASTLVTKAIYASGATWSTLTSVRAGAGLFVRLTTMAGNAGWGEGALGNEHIDFDSAQVNYAERTANPYNHTSLTSPVRIPMRKFNTTLKYVGYAAVEIAYIPLSA